MRRRNLQKFLQELSPEVFSYLFPGFEPEPEIEACAEETPMMGSALPTPIFDMVELEVDHIEKAQVLRRTRKASKAGSIFHRRSLEETTAGPEEEQLDPRTEEILAEIRRLQEKYNVSIDELEILLGYTVRLSPLRITKGGRIYLTDYENKEVKMPNVSKALYFLFLRHPEGLRFKDVADHKEELLHIYQSISGRDVPEEMEKSIDLLVDPYGNALNVNSSRIKTAFRNAVSDRIARFYYIVGAAGEEKKVPLDRDLVLWDY